MYYTVTTHGNVTATTSPSHHRLPTITVADVAPATVPPPPTVPPTVVTRHLSATTTTAVASASNSTPPSSSTTLLPLSPLSPSVFVTFPPPPHHHHHTTTTTTVTSGTTTVITTASAAATVNTADNGHLQRSRFCCHRCLHISPVSLPVSRITAVVGVHSPVQLIQSLPH